MMTSSPTVSSYNIDLKDHIRTVSGFPKAGIEFRDISSLLENPKSFNDIGQDIKENVDYIVNLRQSEVMNTPSSIIKIDVNGTIQKIR